MSMAVLRGTSRAMRTRPPVEAIRPTLGSVRPKRACSAATTMSQETAISMPPPAATPLTAQIVGFGHRRSVMPPKPWSVTVMHSPPLDSSERSSPAQKAFTPVPVTTMTRTRLSFSALFMMSSMAAEVTALIALRFTGRLMRMMSTPSSRRSVTTSWVPWKFLPLLPSFYMDCLEPFRRMLCASCRSFDFDSDVSRDARSARFRMLGAGVGGNITTILGKALIARNRVIIRNLRGALSGCHMWSKPTKRRKPLYAL